MTEEPPKPPDNDLVAEPRAIGSGDPDEPLVAEEAEALAREKEGHQRDLDREELLGLQQARTLRGRMFFLLVAWLSGIGAVVLLQGFGLCGFNLSPVATSTVISSGTIPVVAILVALLSYVFSRHGNAVAKKIVSAIDSG